MLRPFPVSITVLGLRALLAKASLLVALCLFADTVAATDSWTSRGPWGGHVSAVKVVAGTPSTILVASDRGLYRSTDGAQSFTAPATGLPNTGVNSIARTSAGVLLAAMHSNGGLFRSTDVGLTWTEVVYPNSVTNIVVTDPVNPATSYVASNNMVGSTTDGGATWNTRDLGFYILDLLPTSAGSLLAGTDNGVDRSTDSGATWVASNTGLPASSIRTLASDPTSPLVVYAGVAGGLYRSTDAGQTWNSDPSFGATPVWAIGVSGANIWAGGDVGLRRSTNGGANWNAPVSGYIDQPTCFAVDPSLTSVVYSGGFSLALWKSTDTGATWTTANQGISATNLTTLVADPRSQLVLAASTRLFRSLDGGGSWGGATPFDVVDAAFDGVDGVVAAGPDNLTRSTDRGGTWAVISGPANPGVAHLAFDRNSSPVRLYSSKVTGSVRRSTDEGSTWSALATGIPVSSSIRALGVSTHPVGALPTGTVFAAASDGIWISIDGGASFSPSLGQAPGPVYGVFSSLDFDSSGRAYVSTDSQLFRMNPNGSSWSLVTSPPVSVLALAASPTDLDTLFSGTTNRAYRSTDGGVTWTPAGLDNQIVNRLAFGANGTILHAAVGNRGAYELAIPAALYTLAPCRLVDTRAPIGPFGGPSLPGGGQRVFVLGGACGIPATAKSVALNITVVNPASDGSLQLFASDQLAPGTSVLNCQAGRTRANNLVSSVSVDGTASVAVTSSLSSTTDLVIDVVGFFR